MKVLNTELLARSLNPSIREFKPEELNHWLAPQFTTMDGGFRCLVTGMAGTGKTNAIVSAIVQNQIKFDHLLLYARDPTTPKYQLLLQWVVALEDAWEAEHGERKEMATVITDPEKIVPLDSLLQGVNYLALFDDMLMEKNQRIIEDYYVRGRARFVSCIYLTQSYVNTSDIIRGQAQYFIFFKPNSKTDAVQLCKHHSLEYEHDEMKLILKQATADRNSFLLIDRFTKVNLLSIRKNWDEVLDENLKFRNVYELLRETVNQL